ncbi:MAG: MFS transporter [Woeseiaceae bacterium]
MTRNSGLMYLNLAHFFDHFFLLVFPTAVIAIESDWSLTYGEALALGTSMYVAFAIATLPAGWLGDHVDRRTLITVFFFGCGAASIATGLATGGLSLAIGMAFLGAFTAIYHPVGMALVIELAERPGRSLAVNGVFGNMGLAGSALVTGLLTQQFGWRSAFIVPGLISVAIGLTYGWQNLRSKTIGREGQQKTQETFAQIDRTAQMRVFAIVIVSAIFGGAVFNAVTITLPKLFDERLLFSGIDLSQVGGYAALVFAVAAFAQLPVGDLLDRYGARPILIGLLIPQVATLALIATLQGPMVVPTAMLLVLLMFAEVPITSWLLGHFVAPHWRARAFSVEYVLSLGLGALVVPLIAWGHRNGHGFSTQYLLLAACAGTVLVAALFLPAWRNKSASRAAS